MPIIYHTEKEWSSTYNDVRTPLSNQISNSWHFLPVCHTSSIHSVVAPSQWVVIPMYVTFSIKNSSVVHPSHVEVPLSSTVASPQIVVVLAVANFSLWTNWFWMDWTIIDYIVLCELNWYETRRGSPVRADIPQKGSTTFQNSPICIKKS